MTKCVDFWQNTTFGLSGLSRAQDTPKPLTDDSDYLLKNISDEMSMSVRDRKD